MRQVTLRFVDVDEGDFVALSDAYSAADGTEWTLQGAPARYDRRSEPFVPLACQ
jgi:hypothetical protein